MTAKEKAAMKLQLAFEGGNLELQKLATAELEQAIQSESAARLEME